MARGILGLAVVGLTLSACAHTGGGKAGLMALLPAEPAPSSIGAVKRGDNLYDVVYLGKAEQSSDYMRDMTLYQSAELCQQQGFKYFKASDTPAYSNHSAPSQPSQDAPKLTLQVSCLLAENDASVTYGVDTVITRVRTNYNLK